MMNHRQPVATASSYYHHHAAGHHPSPAATSFHPHAQHYHETAHGPLVYRPLQLPLAAPTPTQQQQHSQQQRQQQHHHTPQHSVEQPAQIPLAAVGAGPYQHPTFRHHQTSISSHRTRAQTRQRQHSTMAYDQGHHQTTDEELAQMQELSAKYEPEVTGPLVGQRQPSTAITTEYASADPVYQAKTTTLPQKYSHYRTVRGDGKCGWRAVAFGYFEALIHNGDTNTIMFEMGRLESMKNIIVTAGFDPMMVEEFSDEFRDLLRGINEAMQQGGNALELVENAFNDDLQQNYIITHLRTATSSWMKTRDEYAPWLLGSTVEEYCKNQIEPMAAEIDHVGLVALKDALLSPAGISLEVLYLDRSEGSEVTMHRFDPVNGGGYAIGRVRLLYRPGHYDLLYKPEDLPAPPPPPPAPVPTYLQFATQAFEPVQDLGVSEWMTSIPGMSYANMSQSSSWTSSNFSSGADFFNTPAPVSSCAPAVPTPPPAPATQPHVQSQAMYVPSSTPTQMVPPPTQMPHEMAIRTSVPQHTLGHPDLPHQLSGGPFRPSVWQLEPDFVQATSSMPFQTSIFRNSHFNTAHFLNPEFQPEQWDPDDEYATAASSTKTQRHKNSG
ncbi:hypothetical protein DOTSEDRAFT_75461 [Dothistroma septosporum NZE10]|uniref:ubiquitinyl hydrolase 1 n=1 Tax=Dothistroma septosporum (strain NZE10 / CBS 128990) TaxID=675120 RepID=M2XGV7_DOTSN|nr:hypothetical protein DOTSEDRAFT_75461 [Dothistroma septosporum NZE10]